MAKAVSKVIKIQLEGGKANPAGVGTVLGPTGINMGEFCQRFNEETKNKAELFPTVITVYDDRSYEYILKEPPASWLIKNVISLSKGSDNSKKNKVGTMTNEQLEEITNRKMKDLNAYDFEAAKKILAGTARSMGVEIVGGE